MVAVVVVAVMWVAACGSDDEPGGGGGPSGGDAASVLGDPDRASGEPLKIGFVGDGQTPAIDNTSQLVVAEATVQYLNEYRAGIGGRPIEMVSCETDGDQAKSLDCAAELVQEEVVLAVLPGLSTLATVWGPLHDAGIPVFTYSTTDEELLADTESTFALGSPRVSLIDVPAAVAEENGSDKVVGVIIDVPAATALFEQQGEELFGEAGLDFELVAIPPGQPDMTPQMAEVAEQDNITVQIVGNDAFAIAAMQGLQASGFDGPISCIGCDTDAARQALGSSLEGVTVSGQARGSGPDDPDVQLYEAVIDTYAPDLDSPGDLTPMASYLTWMAARVALDGLSGEITPETVIEAFKSMPSTELPLYLGGQFRCNGQADPMFPAVCGHAAVFATLDAEGYPIEFQVTQTDAVPD